MDIQLLIVFFIPALMIFLLAEFRATVYLKLFSLPSDWRVTRAFQSILLLFTKSFH